MLTIRPRGVFDNELQITICDQRSYANAVIENLAFEQEDGLERTVGDCIVIDRPIDSAYVMDLRPVKAPPVYKVKIDSVWVRFSSLADAKTFVTEVREEQRELDEKPARCATLNQWGRGNQP